jgi:predicted amidohydrolase YtcJ
MQPVHMLADIATCERHVGPRGRWAFPLRSLLDAGATLGFGSDAPVEIMDPLAGFRAALERRGHGGVPEGGWYPQERISPEEALRCYTAQVAWLAGEEALKGTLEVGKLADFVVLSGDILRLPPDELEGVRVLATVVGGRVAHDAEGVLEE